VLAGAPEDVRAGAAVTAAGAARPPGASPPLPSALSSSARAWLRERRWNYDVLILDLGLPRKTGDAACRELRVLGCDVPILALTGTAAPHDVARLHALGFSRVREAVVREVDGERAGERESSRQWTGGTKGKGCAALRCVVAPHNHLRKPRQVLMHGWAPAVACLLSCATAPPHCALLPAATPPAGPVQALRHGRPSGRHPGGAEAAAAASAASGVAAQAVAAAAARGTTTRRGARRRRRSRRSTASGRAGEAGRRRRGRGAGQKRIGRSFQSYLHAPHISERHHRDSVNASCAAVPA
jgi:CheY-like chemotaxis protein